MNRRDFARLVAGAAAGLGMRSPTQGPLPTRPLGRTGLDVPILSLGGSHVGSAGSEAVARRLVETAYAEGIRFFDTAESYQAGRSERWIGLALRDVRQSVWLMSKTFAFPERTAESARRHLEGSLERLRTDYLDFWQLHSIRSVADVDRAFGPGGAMEYLLEARARNLVRYIGVTGHARPAAHLRALQYWDRGIRFEVMQLPLNPVDYHQRSFQREVLPELVERGIGVIAMKTSADGRLVRDRLCTAAECLRYVWSLPVALAVVGMERPALVRENARLAREFQPMAAGELDALRARIAPRARLALEWYKR
ncbi:MAG TPA: aldo/keto reductase [Gemmatimonadales bacterium]|nr:aldo/keto reductase [Gemmatimonadales bacterium]